MPLTRESLELLGEHLSRRGYSVSAFGLSTRQLDPSIAKVLRWEGSGCTMVDIELDASSSVRVQHASELESVGYSIVFADQESTVLRHELPTVESWCNELSLLGTRTHSLQLHGELDAPTAFAAALSYSVAWDAYTFSLHRVFRVRDRFGGSVSLIADMSSSPVERHVEVRIQLAEDDLGAKHELTKLAYLNDGLSSYTQIFDDEKAAFESVDTVVERLS